jgi:hypothetical protein
MYAVGGFDFPASTGSQTVVTGLDFQPVGVIMFGGNRSEVDTLVTGATGPGVFISLNALDYSDGTTIRSLCLAINGKSDSSIANYRGFENGPISMQTDAASAATVDYRASSITFTADGFSLNVTTAAGSRRPIHYMAWGGEIGGGDATNLVSSAVKQQMTGSPTFNNSYEPRSAFVVNTIAANGFGEGYVDGNCWFSFGSGHYPANAANPDAWKSSTIHTQIQLFSALGRQGFTNQVGSWVGVSSDPTLLNIAHVMDALGPVLIEGYRRHRPNYGVDMTQMINEGGGGAGNKWEYAVWWNGEGWTAEASSPASGTNTYSRPSNFEVFEAVLFSTCNGVSSTGNATKQRFGFGILGPDYQGCVVFGADGSFFQSDSKAVAHCTASGASVGVGTLNASSFSLTNDSGGGADMIYHAFGRGSIAFWLPHIYRRVLMGTSNAPADPDYPSVTQTSGPGAAGGGPTGGGPVGAVMVGSGSKQFVRGPYSKGGYATSGLVGSGARSGGFVRVKGGAATAGTVGSGVSVLLTTGYLLLEDGTSKITLEEGGGFLLL